MSIANKYNRPQFLFTGSDDFEFKKMIDLYNENPNKVYKLKAFFTNPNNKFGLTGTIVTENEFVNCNELTAKMLIDMQSDKDVIDACNNDKLGFKLIKKHSNKFNTDYCVIELTDL